MEGVIGLASIIGLLFGLVAFVRTLDFGAKIETLEHEIASLRATLLRRAEPPQTSRSEAATTVAAPAATIATPVAAPTPARLVAPVAPPTTRAAPPRAAEAPAPAGAAPRDKAATPPLRTQTTRMEARLSGNWLIWVGGAALAFGGAFLLKAAVDAGFFGPVMRIAAAALAGGAMIAAGDWARRTQDRENSKAGVSAAWRRSIAPPVLAGAGGATLYATVYAAFAIYQMMPAFVALVMLTAASASLVVLAMRHRAPPLAQMGLGGAYLAPLLAGGGADGAVALLIYVFAVSAAGFLLMRKMGWRAAGLIALAGGLCWPAMLIAAGAAPAGVAVYLPAFLALAAAAAWRDASKAPEPDKIFAGEASSPVILGMFHFALLGVVILAFLAGAQRAGTGIALPLWGSIAALTLFLASRRDGFSFAPLAAFAGVVIATVFSGDRGVGEPGASAALAAVFGAGGAFAMQLRQRKGPLAVVAAVGPVTLLTLQFWLNSGAADKPAIALAALALGGANVGILAHLRRRSGSFDAHPGAASAFVVGASFASCLAIVALFDGLFLSVALAAQTPVMALLWRRYSLIALRYVSTAIAVAASARLLLLPEVADYAFGAAPVFNLLLAGYAAPAAAFWFAARAFERGGAAKSAPVVQALEGAAIALFAAFVTLEIRHLFNHGDVGARSLTLFELSLQIASWMSVAAFMRWRFGAELTPVRRVAEYFLTALSLGAAFIGPLTLFNPAWGADPEPIPGPPVFNFLLLYYLAPALAFAAAGIVARRAGALAQSRLTGAAGAVLGLMWLSLAIRQGFHAPDLSRGGVALAEVSLNVIAWLVIAAALCWRYRAKGAPVIHAAEQLLMIAAGFFYLSVLLILRNPWWGVDAAPVGGALIVNMTLLHYGAPALALAAYAYAAQASAAMLRSRALGLASAFAGLVFLVMEVRHAFHAPFLSQGGVGLAEAWSYSAVMTLYAAALLIAGALRRSDILRRAGFAVLLLAIAKVFLIDLSGLEGLWRATSFLGLGAAVVGIAIVYQRLNRAPA